MEFLSESLQTYANLLLGLMPANYTTTRCVNPCPPVFIRVGISIQKPIESHLDRTRPVALKKWMSYFQRTRPDCKIESFYTTSRQKKIDRFSVDGFCSHCNTLFEAMGCFYHFCPCQELFHFSLKKLSNVAVGEENSMNLDEAVYKRKVSLSLKCGNVVVETLQDNH